MLILFVCSANQCRSAIAEKIARSLSNHLDLHFASAGVGGYGSGYPVTAQTADILVAHDLPTEHVSRVATSTMLTQADLILGMTQTHAQLASALAPYVPVTTLTTFAVAASLTPPYPGESPQQWYARILNTDLLSAPDIPDPVLEPERITYEDAYTAINEALTTVLSPAS